MRTSFLCFWFAGSLSFCPSSDVCRQDFLSVLRAASFRFLGGLLWGVVLLGLFVIRILIEERTLRKELQGYDEYTETVRYRLVPLVW